MKWSIASKETAKIFFCCDKDEFYVINEILDPFIGCAYDVQLDNEAWKISNGNLYSEISKSAILMKNKLVDEDEPEREIYISPLHKEIILKRPVDKKWRTQVLIRLIRDMLRNLCVETSNYLHMHAAMVRYKGQGICYLGDKKSGKTSFMFSMLLNGSDFVSNDDLSFAIKDNKIYGVGWPRAVSVRNDLFQALNINNTLLEKNVLTHPSNKNQLSKDYTFFYPKELIKTTNADIKEFSLVDILIFGGFCGEDEKAGITRVDSKEKIKQMITENVLFNYNKHSKEFESVFKTKPNIENYINMLKEIPAYIIKQDFKNMSQTIELLNGIGI